MAARIQFLAVAALSAAASPAAAVDTVYVESPGLTVDAIHTIVVGAKYRLSNTNFDASLDAGGGTQNVGASPNFVSAGLGNNASLNGRNYAFSFEHIAGEGFIFRMTDLTTVANGTRTLAWGSFTTPLPTGTIRAATLAASAATGAPIGSQLAPGLPFNALHIEWRSETRAGQSYSPSVAVSDLSFSSPGLAQDGSLVAAYTATAGGNPPSAIFPDPSNNYFSQWLVATTDLAARNFTLAGKVRLAFTGTPGNVDEFVRFDVSGKQVDFTAPFPEPGTWALLISGFGWVGAGLRRQRARLA